MPRHYRVEKSLRVILLKSKVSPNSVIFERIRQQQCQQQRQQQYVDDDDFEDISNAIVQERAHQLPAIKYE